MKIPIGVTARNEAANIGALLASLRQSATRAAQAARGTVAVRHGQRAKGRGACRRIG